MGDNFQTGRITTLHRLVDRPIEELEAELVRFSLRRPMGLILPSLYSELEGPALPNIVNHLAKVPYLSQIVIGLDQASELEYKSAVKFFSNLPQNHQILWNDGPSLMAIDEELREMKLARKRWAKVEMFGIAWVICLLWIALNQLGFMTVTFLPMIARS